MTVYSPGDQFELLVVDIFREIWPLQQWTPDDKVLGQSGVLRQIDLSVRSTTALGTNAFKILEVKDWNKRIPIGEIEKLAGLSNDVQANAAAMVAAHGYTRGSVKRANTADIALLTIVDPAADHRWRSGFNASTVLVITLIEDMRLHFDDDTGYSVNQSDMNPLCMQVYDDRQRNLGRIHDIISDHLDLPVDECTLFDYPLVENQVLIRDIGAADGFRTVFLTGKLKIRTEAWIKKVPLVSGKGLYNENTSRAILADDAIFEAIDFSQLRTQWSRVRDLELLPMESMLVVRAVALNQHLCPISHNCE